MFYDRAYSFYDRANSFNDRAYSCSNLANLLHDQPLKKLKIVPEVYRLKLQINGLPASSSTRKSAFIPQYLLFVEEVGEQCGRKNE